MPVKEIFSQKLIKLAFRTIALIVVISFSDCQCTSAEPTQGGKSDDKTRVLTLNQAIELVLKKNRSLSRSSLGLNISKFSLEAQKSEFSVKVRPQTYFETNSTDDSWQLGLGLSKKSEHGITTSITPKIEREQGDTDRSGVTLSVHVPLLRGFGRDMNLDNLHSSMFELEEVQLSFQQQQVAIVLDTVATVYAIIQNQQQIQMLTDELDLLKDHLKLTKAKELSRLVSAMDLYRAELRLKDVQNEMTSVREQMVNNSNKLKELLTFSLSENIIVSASVHYKPIDISLNDAIRLATEKRIELKQLKNRIIESKRKMILAKKNILPNLNLNMSYERFGDNDSFELDEEQWSVSLNSDFDLSRTSERTSYLQSQVSYKGALLDLESEKERIAIEVRNQLNNLKKQEILISDRKKQAQQAKGKLELSLSKFRHGMAGNFDLIESQSELQRVRSDLLADTMGHIVGIYRLRAAIGTLLDKQEGPKE